MEVFAPAGNLLGTIKQLWDFCYPKFIVKDNKGKALFKIGGPCCVFGTVDFPVTSAQNGEELGIITKKWGGWGVEAFTYSFIHSFIISAKLTLGRKNISVTP